MDLYYRFGNRFAVFLELSKQLGPTPFLQIKTCKGEIILDIPYGQFILTAPSKLAALNNDNRHVTNHDQQQHTNLPQDSAGIPEN